MKTKVIRAHDFCEHTGRQKYSDRAARLMQPLCVMYRCQHCRSWHVNPNQGEQRMRMLPITVLLLLCAVPALAQQHPCYGVGCPESTPVRLDTPVAVAEIHPSTPRFEIFVGPSFSQLAVSAPNNFKGAQVAVDYNVGRRFAIVADFGAQRTTFERLHYDSYEATAGPELRIRRRVTPFVHVLAGFGSDTFNRSATDPVTGISGVTTRAHGLALLGGGGIDTEIGRHFAIRAQADYVSVHENSAWNRYVRVGGGIVFRFGGSPRRAVETPAHNTPSTPIYRDIPQRRSFSS
jgi:hypothetical protein